MKNLISLIFSLICITSLHAQPPFFTGTTEPVVWEELGSLPTSILSFSEHNGRIWAANESLFYSDDDGLTWTRQETVVHQEIQQVVSLEQGTIAGRTRVQQVYVPYGNLNYLNLFRSVDDGLTFPDTLESIDIGAYHFGESYSPGIFKKSDTELMKIEGNIGVNPNSEYSFSSDGGETWEQIEFLIDSALVNFQNDCRCTSHNNRLQLVLPFDTDSLRFMNYPAGSYDADELRIALPAGFTGDYAYFNNGRIFIAQDNSLTYSDDEGITWTTEEYDMPGEITTDKYYFGKRSIIRATDAGVWEIDYADLTHAELLSIPKFELPGFYNYYSYYESNYYPYFEAENADFFSNQSGVYRRGLGESEFTIVANGLSKDANSIRVFGEILWARRGDALYTSANAGETWELRNEEELYFSYGQGANLLGSHNGNMFVRSSEGVFKGANTGEATDWTAVPGVTGSAGIETEGGLFIYNSSSLFHTLDGENFVEKNHPINGGAFVYLNEELLCFKDGIRYASTDLGETWTMSEYAGSLSANPLALNNSLVAFDDGDNSFYKPESSVDGGHTWFPLKELWPNGGYVNYTSYAKYHGHAADMAFYSTRFNFAVTGNGGADWYSVQIPFTYYESFTFFTYGYASNEIPGPLGVVGTGDYIIAYSTDQGIYRTPIAGIKDQIDTTFQERSIVTGRMYKDWNDNCIYDDGDTPMAGKVISVGNEHGYSNDAGLYAVYLPPTANSYAYETAPVLYQEMNCENGLTGLFLSDVMDTDTIDIPFHPIAGISDLEVNIFSAFNFRPGQEATLGVRVKNVANTTFTNYQLSINYDPIAQTFVSADVGGVDVEAGLITFPINLDVEESNVYYFRLLNSEDLNIGDILSHTATVENPDDETPENNTDTYTVEVTASHDPNDKTVWSDGDVLPENATELTYRLRFQNTGTDTAFKVVVIDTLPAQLDLLTFEMLDASHDYELKINNPGILEWTFDNILLPDSTTNEPASHGYIFFKIKTLEDVVDGDELPNDVAIYFDFNEPVITNEVVTIVEKGKIEYYDVYEICEGEEWNDMIVTESFTTIDTAYGTVYDTIQTVEVVALPTYENEFNITGGTGTIIEGEIMTEDTQLSEMYLSQSGCDSLVTYNFTLQQIEITQEIEVCEGDMWNEIPVFDGMTFSDTIYNPLADTIINSQISILQTYSNELAFGASVGANINGTIVYSDTTFTLDFETWQGCDSLITYMIDIISAVEVLDNQLFSAKVFPNPTAGKVIVTIQSDKSYLLNAAILSIKGGLLFEPLKNTRVTENGFTFDVGLENIPAGVYYLRLEAEGELQYLKIVKMN